MPSHLTSQQALCAALCSEPVWTQNTNKVSPEFGYMSQVQICRQTQFFWRLNVSLSSLTEVLGQRCMFMSA